MDKLRDEFENATDWKRRTGFDLSNWVRNDAKWIIEHFAFLRNQFWFVNVVDSHHFASFRLVMNDRAERRNATLPPTRDIGHTYLLNRYMQICINSSKPLKMHQPPTSGRTKFNFYLSQVDLPRLSSVVAQTTRKNNNPRIRTGFTLLISNVGNATTKNLRGREVFR